MTCRFCQRAQKDNFRDIQCAGIESVDTCPTGDVPKLLPANQRFWWLFARIMPGLMDGFGGIRYEAITIVFDMYQIPAGQRPILLDKCIAVIGAISEARKEDGKPR